jgi:hypothetical protein
MMVGLSLQEGILCERENKTAEVMKKWRELHNDRI